MKELEYEPPELRLIRRRSELRGTRYIEFLPGHYQGESRGDESVFFADHATELLEPALPAFDRYGYRDVLLEEWTPAILRLTELADAVPCADSLERLDRVLDPLPDSWRGPFTAALRDRSEELAVLLEELADWLAKTLREQECVAILGL